MVRIALVPILAAGCLWAQTPKRPITDTYGKVTVTDDYRWLENFDDPAVKQWADAQNASARGVLDALPERDALAGELRRVFQPAKTRSLR